MFPKTKSGEQKHAQKKREIEISTAIKTISNYQKACSKETPNNCIILEVGSGGGFQTPYLQCLGRVVACDIYTANKIKSSKNAHFVQSSITEAPFKNGQFDLVFSNHVIEHIENVEEAFREIQRIGRQNCIYAFAVPTNIWLLLAIPSQYWSRIKRIVKRVKVRGINHSEKSCQVHNINKGTLKKMFLHKLLRYVMPRGHGVRMNFGKCFSAFKINSWISLFEKNNFRVKKVQSLLLYAPSGWPIIPTMKACDRLKLCSSVLFIMQKSE